MEFNKEQYRERRNRTRKVEVDNPKKPGKKMKIDVPAPVRGQWGDRPPVVYAKWSDADAKAGRCLPEEVGREMVSRVQMRMTKEGLQAYPRRAQRQKIVDRTKTKKGAAHVVGVPNEGIILPQTDPTLSNHTRMQMRAKYRGAGLVKSGKLVEDVQ